MWGTVDVGGGAWVPVGELEGLPSVGCWRGAWVPVGEGLDVGGVAKRGELWMLDGVPGCPWVNWRGCQVWGTVDVGGARG